jgi:hypothetical protein
MASVCVRNTVIEDYHSRGNLSQEQMKAFNKEVANKIYTFLKFFLSGSARDTEALMNSSLPLYPFDWDDPVLDREMLEAVKAYKKGDLAPGDELDDEPWDPVTEAVGDVLEEKRDAH